jgi:hypothetical protein
MPVNEKRKHLKKGLESRIFSGFFSHNEKNSYNEKGIIFFKLVF